MALIGKVVAMTGVAYLITDNGSKRELQLGDQINVGDTIQTPPGVEVDLELASGRIVHISAEQLVAFTEELSTIFAPNELDSALNLATIDTVIKAIEEGKDINAVLEETAAGVSGTFSSYGFGFVDLFRINDILNAFRFAYSIDSDTGINNELLGNDDNNYASLADSEDADAGLPTTTNNAPVATSLSIGRAEGTGTISGTLPASDVDGDTLVYSPFGALPAGLVINPDGSFTFDYSDPVYDGLALGTQQVLVVPYEVSDGKGGTSSSTLTITINGAEDAPVIGGVVVGTVAEDGTQTASGALSISDVDTNDNPVSFADQGATLGSNSYGSFVLAGGTWTYTLDNAAVQFLDDLETATDSITYTATDGSTQTITVTINGAEDAAILTVDNATVTLSETAGAGLIAGADADATDIDGGTLTYSFSGSVPVDGSGIALFSINSGTGEISLTAAGAAFIDYESATKSYTLSVVANDGIGDSNIETITINLANENDNAPNIVDSSVTFDENIDAGTLVYNVSDSFTGTDFDRDGAAITYSITGGNTDGIFVIDSSTGVITIAAGKTLNYETASIHNLIVTASDSSLSDTATITVNVNNLVTEAFNDSGAVNENATLTVGSPGVLANDFDNNSNPIQVSAVNGVAGNVGAAISGTYGSLTLNTNGSYTYVANNAESLAAGATASDVFTYTITNGLGGTDTATLTITLTGTNDVPVFGGADTGAVTEDVGVVSGNLTTTGILTVTDIEAGQSAINAAVLPISVGYNLGSLVINAAGEWTYTVANDAVQYLGDGETRDEVFTVTSIDGSTHNITVTITGDQDNPTAQDTTIPIPKDATHILTADDFGIVDADTSDALIVTITSIPGQGLLKYYDGGAWVIVAPNDQIPYEDIQNGLLVFVPATGDTGNESFGYTVSDGVFTTSGNTVTFSINIELSVSSPLPVDEGKATVFAVELSDARAVSTVLTLTLGGEATGDDYVTPMQYRIQNADGSYTTWQNVSGGQITLSAGQTRAEVKVKTVANDDGSGVTSESLTLTATTTAAADLANASATGETSINDLPSLLVSGASYVSEGGITTFDLELSNIKATDTAVTLSFEGVATLGVDFDYSIDGGTTWISSATSTITLTGSALSNPSFEVQVRTLTDVAIESDEVLRVVAVTTDAGIANIGSPVTASTLIVDPIVASTSEDVAVTILSGASYEYAVLGQAGHGTVTSSSGNIIYTPDANWSGADSFTITKTNEVGLSVTSVVTVNVAAVADAPTVTIDVHGPYNNASSSTNYITNGSFETYSGGTGTNPYALPAGTSTTNLTGWSYNTGGGGHKLELYTNQVSGITGTRVLDTSESGQKSTDLTQTITGLTVGTTYELKLDLAIPTGSTGALSIVWNGLTLQSVSQAALTSTLTTFTFRVVAGATNTLLLDATNTADSGGGDATGVFIDNVRLTTPDTYTYTVNVGANVVDSDGSESLTNSFVITGTGLPSDAILRTSTGTLLTRSGTGPYTWTVTSEADLTGLQLTMIKPTVGTGNFTLSATATSIEASNGDTEPGSASTTSINMPINGSGTNLLPVIGNSDITLSNEANFVGTVTETISTQFGDGTNTLSWVSVADSLPNIYAAGELVVYTLTISPDGLTGTVTGTTSAGPIFELVIQLNAGADADVTYTQYQSLLGSEIVGSGESMVMSNSGQDVILTFDAGGIPFDVVVTGENYLDGTPNTVINSSKYIGAANNLMNAGERVTLDFASGTSGNAVALMQISFFNFDSASASAPDELTIYGTTVDGGTFSYYVTNASLDSNGMYTIVAPGGELIEVLTFESGSQSSYKLGIENVSVVNYDANFDLDVNYQLTDADGDSATGTISLTLDGDNAIIGTTADDVLLGGSSNDSLIGNTGADVISGGGGNDTMTGGATGVNDNTSDTFVWHLVDAGTAGTPAVDTITTFGTASAASGGDVLDLRDLLSGTGATTAASLDNFLHFEYNGTNTILHVSSTGAFGNGNSAVNNATLNTMDTQQIVFAGVDLVGALGTDSNVIQNLLTNNKLITD